jgi:peptidoglycan/LPS O-acetylase OafA/YrhL
LETIEKIAVPVLIVQAISVVFMLTLDSIAVPSQRIYEIFLAADILAFGLLAHVWVSTKTGDTPRSTTLLAWGLAIMLIFAAGFIYS